MENRLKEIAGNLKRDVRDLLDESANIVTGLFKQGLCTANGMTTRWNAFTHGLSQAAKELFRPCPNLPAPAESQQPLVTVRESTCEELPVGIRMTLSEAEERMEELNLSMLDSGGLIQDVKVTIDYRLNGEEDRYWLPLQIGAGQGSMLEQMEYIVQSCLHSPDSVTQDFYTASPGLGELLHEHFGPQLQEDLEKLAGQVLGYFRQHCTITRLEQQFMRQAQAMPERDQRRFQESARTAIAKLRRAANTGQAVEPVREQAPPVYGDAQLRQSVKVRLHRVKEGQQKQPVLHKARNDPQR